MAEGANPKASATTSATAPMASKPFHAHKHSGHRKGSDPFLNLDDPLDPQKSQPSLAQADVVSTNSSESLFTDLIMTPLHMITFILSLSLIDYRQRQWRLSQHAPEHETLWFRLTHWSWLHPEPYQDAQDSTWKNNDKASIQGPPNTAFEGWSTQKKHRAMAKMEISDAFDIRGRVVVALIAWAFVGAVGLTFVTKRLYGWVSGW